MGDDDAVVVDCEESRDSNSVAVPAEHEDLCPSGCHHFPAEMTTRNSFSTIFLWLNYQKGCILPLC